MSVASLMSNTIVTIAQAYRGISVEPISALVAIIAAGASSAISETTSQAVKDAYAGVKALLAPRLSSWAGLEANPTDADSRNAVVKEMERLAANDNRDVLNEIRELLATLKTEPREVLQQSGVSIADVNAASDLLIKDVKYGQYFHVARVSTKTGRIEISGISSGADDKKN